MSVALSMIPYYLFSNFHCFGMCGPIAALIGRHPFWPLYLTGRIAGFSLMGAFCATAGQLIAWEMGSFRALLSLFFGALMIIWCMTHFSFASWGQKLQILFVKLFNRNEPWTPGLIGLATPLLPCGQSMIVFAFCALLAHPLEGFIQGLIFSLLTTPSLFLAIKGLHRLTKYKKFVDPLSKLSVGIVGLLCLLRGFADLEIIPHYSPLPQIHLTLW